MIVIEADALSHNPLGTEQIGVDKRRPQKPIRPLQPCIPPRSTLPLPLLPAPQNPYNRQVLKTPPASAKATIAPAHTHERNREFLSGLIAWRQRHGILSALKHASTFIDLRSGRKWLCPTQRRQFMGADVDTGARPSFTAMLQARTHCQKYKIELRLSRSSTQFCFASLH